MKRIIWMLANFFDGIIHTTYILHYARTARVGGVAVAHDHPRIDPHDMSVPPSLSERKRNDVHRDKFYLLPNLTVFSASNWSGS